MKLALRFTLVAILAAALFYRFARHDASKYYLLYAAWSAIFAIYTFRFAKKSK